MKTHLRVFAIVVMILAIGCGTASAYSKDSMNTVLLNMDGIPRMVTTDKATVGELMQDLAQTTDTDYVVTNAQDTDVITEDMQLTLTAVTEKMVSTTKSIPYETLEMENPDLASGERRVTQKGVNGVVRVTNKEIYHGTELVDTVFVEEVVTTEPVVEIIEYGPENVIDGYRYSKAIQVRATAYTPYDPGCTGITATGMKATKGVVAVDPRVIPLGSQVYVPGYGVAIAADTGGAIKGNRLDVCYNTLAEAYTWGVKNVTVYVLE